MDAQHTNRAVLTLLAIWGMTAVSIGASGLMHETTPLAIPGVVVTASLAFLGFCASSASVREWTIRVPMPALMFVHLVRLVGFYFLHLYSRGLLPHDFAVVGGIGDIVIALTGIPIAWLNRRPGDSARLALRVWNIAGLFDIAMVVAMAARHLHQEPLVMAPLRELPLVLLPLFFVPLIISSHVLISIRLFWERRGYPPGTSGIGEA